MFEWLFGKRQAQSTCNDCGELSTGAPSFSFQFPRYYFDVPEEDLEERVLISEDLCHIRPGKSNPDEAHIFCIRVVLEIPIFGADDPFTWGVWVTQSEASFENYVKTFGQDQSSLGSFGWLPVDLPFYNQTAAGQPVEHLECDVVWGADGQRPKVHLRESAHPLTKDQRDGISWKKAMKIARIAQDACACRQSGI